MIINEIHAKNIITKSNLPAADYVVNPYIGCNHACIYCYARFMKRFTRHEEKWGQFVDVKINAIDLIPNKSNKYIGKSVFLSSVTDPYIPLEKNYELTRGILKKLIPLQPNIGVQTKSGLVTRDIDLLQKFENCEVGLTITTLDDNLRKKIEPYTSSIQNRIDALKKLKGANIKTYIFIGPILPTITDWKSIIGETKSFVDFYMFENLNIHGSIASDINNFLLKHYPSLTNEYNNIYNKKSDYWANIEKDIIQFCNIGNVDYKIFFHHKAKSK